MVYIDPLPPPLEYTMEAFIDFLNKIIFFLASFAVGMITMYILFMNELQSYVMLHKP